MTHPTRSRILRLEDSLEPDPGARPDGRHGRHPDPARASRSSSESRSDTASRSDSARRSYSASFDPGTPLSLHRMGRGLDWTTSMDVDPTISGPGIDPTSHEDPTVTVAHRGAGDATGTISVGPQAAAPAAPAATAPVVTVAPAETAAPATPVAAVAAAPAAGAVDAPTDPLGGWQVAPAATQEEAFSEDIRAILAHASSVRGSGSPPSPTFPLPAAAMGQAPLRSEPAAAPGIGAGAGHDVFEQMAAANSPSRFDQAPVSLSVDFARLDRAAGMDVAPAVPAPVVTAPVATAPPAVAPVAVGTPTAGAAPALQPPSPAADVGQPVATAPVNTAPVNTAPVNTAPGSRSDVDDVAAITGAAGPFRIVSDVPLIAQTPGLTCHASAAASIVAWRDDVPPNASDVAAGTGYWERFASGRTAGFPDVLDAFGLSVTSVGAPPSAAKVRDLIDSFGPLWLAASPPREHAVVLSGITGDGTASGSVVDVVDPWAEGMTAYAAPNPGSRYSLPYATLLSRFASADGSQIVLAHLRKGSS